MGTTPNYTWPYPELTDKPDGASQIKALANAADATVKAQVGAATVGYTPTWTGMTIGNATSNMGYRRLGAHVLVLLEVRAAASAPTTAFTGLVTFTTPFVPTARATSAIYFETGGVAKLGMVSSIAGNSAITLWAVRQSDLVLYNPSSVWGSATWTTTDRLFGSLLIPI